MVLLYTGVSRSARRVCLWGVLLISMMAKFAHAGDVLPIVFVHGMSGSAQQFETNAMRFTSNNYPQELLFAFEYDSTVEAQQPAIAALDGYIDKVLAQTGASQVYAIGHSRGTAVWTEYLQDNSFNGPDKVARYVNIDGRTLAELPGGVPTIGIWGEWNTAGSGYNRRGNTNAQIGPDPASNYYFGSKAHTEVATSAEAFAVMYAFLTGEDPEVVDVVPEPPGQVNVAGRAVIFPQNIGYDGARVELWRVDAATGQRTDSEPVAQFSLDESGEFGPVNVNGLKHYEFAVIRPATSAAGETVHHFYFEPFSRSNYFIRLNTSFAGDGIEAFLPRDPAYTNVVISRQREFWGDQGALSDVLEINGLNVITDAISPRNDVNLAFFGYDAGPVLPPPFPPFPGAPDGLTDLSRGELFPFTTLTFLTAADVSIPAAIPATGVVSLNEIPRGNGRESTINIPNWASDTHRITIHFREDDPLVQRFTHPRKGKN